MFEMVENKEMISKVTYMAEMMKEAVVKTLVILEMVMLHVWKTVQGEICSRNTIFLGF